MTISPFVSKTVRRLLSCGGHRGVQIRNRLGCLRDDKLKRKVCGQKIRPFGSSIVRTGNPGINRNRHDKENRVWIGEDCRAMQQRWFLGCGNEHEEDALAKIHEERVVIGYSPEQVFGVVAGVDLYQDFVPWCQHSRVIKRNSDTSFEAELEIGFKFLVESYTSHVELNKPNSIKTTVSQSSLFEHLINIWEFNPGPVPGTCDLYFHVDFKFQSPLYRQMALMFFKEVVSRLVSSFTDRCRRVYGPGVPVLED
ncbi:hypothetical protein ZOSMA_116G00680 [Zostera marina]|uniref:Coenzyme Q-binding protein COQ10 START domain-containing protein n=1 Tax=Zostera marina TaxID=29655 RepID=A0A0K9Q498_ZOSMR|nr:hypothetical protein ZOSMA_116G00680 [Zostera marina]